MTDLLLLFGGIVGMLIIGAIVVYVERHGQCKHSWGKWIYSENEFAYVNQRACEKCGFTETNQFRKMKEGL